MVFSDRAINVVSKMRHLKGIRAQSQLETHTQHESQSSCLSQDLGENLNAEVDQNQCSHITLAYVCSLSFGSQNVPL